VSAFQRADFRRFVAENYGPDQMILAAAGGVDHDAIVAQAQAIMGGLAPVRQGRVEAARFTGGERREDKDLEQVHFALAFEAPAARAPEVWAAQVYSMAMGGGMSSRLFQKIREERGLCYSIFAQAGAYDDTGSITIYAGTSEDEIGDLTELTVAELRRSAEDMTEAEVARARAQLKAGMLMGLESPSSRAERLARLLSIWGRVPGVDEAVAKIDAVDVGAVRASARDLLAAPAALALYGPVGGAPGLDDIRGGLVG
ncbi:MAG TPA: pitrilysin family protein, partial [Paracoccaceae bacterium]|nr:pitrilysin family protein [Paracoccaceae bacterium]